MTTAAAPRQDDPASLFATPAIVTDRRADGSIIVKSTTPLKPAARCVGDWLEHWARVAPDRIYLAERTSDRRAMDDGELCRSAEANALDCRLGSGGRH